MKSARRWKGGGRGAEGPPPRRPGAGRNPRPPTTHPPRRAAMKCFHHAEVDATGYCRQCGKALCGDCRRDVRGVVYCEDCLATLATAPAASVPGAPSPGVALALGFIPGVGAIYNGEFAKALLYIIIFGGLISLMDSSASRGAEPLFGMLLAAFYIYMP